MKIELLNTKEKILYQTIELLNQKGISNVKMRDVSETLNISIGNLTYHYPKWKNLINAVFKKFQKDIQKLYLYFPKDISEIVNYIGHIYDIQIKYSFIFSNYHLFFETYPEYNIKKEEFFHERMVIMREALQKLINKNYLLSPGTEHNYDLLVKNTWLILSGWYGFSKMFEGTKYSISKEEFFLSLWNLYVHHLTQEGKEIIKKSFSIYQLSNN